MPDTETDPKLIEAAARLAAADQEAAEQTDKWVKEARNLAAYYKVLREEGEMAKALAGCLTIAAQANAFEEAADAADDDDEL